MKNTNKRKKSSTFSIYLKNRQINEWGVVGTALELQREKCFTV